MPNPQLEPLNGWDLNYWQELQRHARVREIFRALGPSAVYEIPARELHYLRLNPISPQTTREEATEEDGKVLVNGFLVGCDPEFVALDEKGRAINVRRDLTFHGEVGYDHGGLVVELRPRPARGTWTLVKRMKRLLEHPRLRGLPAVKWRAGAIVKWEEEGFQQRPCVTLGGHVHLGIEPYLNPGDVWTDPALSPEHLDRVAALDHLTRRLEALDVLPTRECEARRRAWNGAYGKFGDYRCNPNRDRTHRTEYRTMASWLFDPKVAMVCLTAAKLAAAAPRHAMETLGRVHDFLPLVRWFESFKSKDFNAAQVLKVLEGGLQAIQVPPDVDMRARWEAVEI